MQVDTGTVASNGIELFYESRGPVNGEPLLFIMGLSAQMVFWPEPLLNELADQGYRVIRFDNRDVGKSTRIRGRIPHATPVTMARFFAGLPIKAPYTLHDMVADTVGLMDALGIGRAHLVGASMGGMIGQLLAATHPERVASLTSIMSSTNSRWMPPPAPSALKTLVGPRARIETVDEYIQHGLRTWRILGGTLPQGDELLADMFRQSWERGLYPRGILQQFTGIMATGGFGRLLRRVEAPTTVIHGSHDPLIRPAGGKFSARAIPGAQLEIIRGMGHDLPEVVLPQIAGLIRDNARRQRAPAGPLVATA